LLDSLRPESRVFCRLELGAPWGFRVDAREGVRWHLLLQGFAELRIDGGDQLVRMSAGDLVILPNGSGHEVGDAARSAVPSLEQLVDGSPPDARGVIRVGGTGEACSTLLSGVFSFDGQPTLPSQVLGPLPPVLHCPGGGRSGADLHRLVELVRDELAADQLGSAGLVDRLMEMLFVHVARARLQGWRPALADARVGRVLEAVHADLAADWTLGLLATRADMSRTELAERFRELLGVPPLAYVTRCRIDEAMRLLRTTDHGLRAVAKAVGYRSPSAFGKAFERQVGLGPAAFRRGPTARAQSSARERASKAVATARRPMQKALSIQRGPLPPDLAPADREATRAWLVGAAEQEFARTGRLAPSMRVLMSDHQLLVETAFAPGEREAAVAVFRRLLRSPGAIRGYREGELVANGERRAVILELDPEESAWAVWRAIATADGGVGRWLAPSWEDLDGTEPAIREWLDSGGRSAELGPDRMRATAVAEVQVRMASARLDEPVPADAEGVAVLVGAMLDGEIATKGLACTLVVAFRGPVFDLWEVRGTPRSSVDDTMRAIACFSSAEAIALVTGVVAEFYGTNRRAVAMVAEAGGRRFERAVPLTFDSSGGAFALPPLGRWHGEGQLPYEARWIGPAPTHPVAISRTSPEAG
jgi:AraC-like DNA-binding protein